MSRGLGLSRRLRYLLDRARAIDVGNLTRIARAAGRLRKRPWMLVAVDLLWCSVRYEAAFQDYLDWDFVLLTRRERSTYMTHPKANHLSMKVNDPVLRRTFSDKSLFNPVFDVYLGREWLDIRTSGVDEITQFLDRHDAVMVKVPDSLSGLGIERRESAAIDDVAGFIEQLAERRQFLIEEFIAQHTTMASLNPSSVNSLRIISYRGDDSITVLASVLKMGNGGTIDNFSNGGMYTMLDERGVALYPAFDGSGATYAEHPLTGVPIVGFQVPSYDRVLAQLDSLSQVIPEVPYVGWDIAIGPDGPMVIEGNPNSGVFQAKPSVSGVRRGLLPLYRETFGF